MYVPSRDKMIREPERDKRANQKNNKFRAERAKKEPQKSKPEGRPRYG